jgi:hypothetical protein
MSDWGDHDDDDCFVDSGDDDDGVHRLSNMFFEAKHKGISEDSYADWQAIVAKECESHDDRNFSFKASKRASNSRAAILQKLRLLLNAL